MAIEFFSTIDLNQNEIQRPVIHNSGTIADNSGILGQLYVHNTQNKLYFHDGTNFIDLTAQGDITSVTLTGGNGISLTNTNSSGGDYSSTITLDISSGLTTVGSIAQADLLAFSDESASGDPTKSITFSDLEDQIFGNINSASTHVGVAAGGAVTIQSGVITTAMLATGFSLPASKLDTIGFTVSDGSQSDVINIGETMTIAASSGVSFAAAGSNEFTITGNIASTSALGVSKFSSSDFAVSGAGNVTIKSSGVSNSQLANSAITIGGTSTSLGGTITALTALTDLDLTSGNKTIFDGVGSNTLTMGASGTTITIPGNLVVSGTQTIQNETVQIVENNTILFEGTTNDSNEIKLTGGDPTADRVVTLPDADGTIALTSQITGTNSGTNTGDQLVFKTVSTDSGSAVADTTTDTLTLSGGAGIDTSASGDTITIAAETASSSNAGIVTLASDADAKTGSGTGVLNVAQIAARTIVANVNATSLNNSSNKTVRITHNLGTTDLHITIYDPETEKTVYADVSRTTNGSSTSDNDVFVQFGGDLSGNLRVIITAVPGAASAGSVTYN